jgi:N-methylhydantoinase B/oxoprolinase/acetone carboxylase alpha subunit
MKKKLPMALALLTTVFLIPIMMGCGQGGGNFEQERTDIQGRINTTLDTVNQRLSTYQAAEADTTLSMEARADINARVASLQEMRTDLTTRMERLGAITENEWAAFRDETRTALDQIDKQLQEIPEEVPRPAMTPPA